MPSARFVVFDPEGFNEASDYDGVLEALRGARSPDRRAGAFEVRSTRTPLSFRGLVAGAEVSFALAPITSDWFDSELLVALDRAIAARGVDGRFATTHWIWTGDRLRQRQAGARAEATPGAADVRRGRDRPAIPAPEGEPARSASATPAEGDESDEDGGEAMTATPTQTPRTPAGTGSTWSAPPSWPKVTRPASTSLRASRARGGVGRSRHPRDPHLAVRFRLEDGSTRAVLVRPDGEGWFAPRCGGHGVVARWDDDLRAAGPEELDARGCGGATRCAPSYALQGRTRSRA